MQIYTIVIVRFFAFLFNASIVWTHDKCLFVALSIAYSDVAAASQLLITQSCNKNMEIFFSSDIALQRTC